MVIAAGVGSQMGDKPESVYGTEVVVDRFREYSSETIKALVVKANAVGMMAGAQRFQRTDRTKAIVQGFAGDVTYPLLNKGFGTFFEQALGQNTVATVTGATRSHTCIPDAAAQYGKSLTLQVTRPGIEGTARVFTYFGGKIVGWELSGALDQPVMLTGKYDFKSGDVDTSAASASYTATQEPFIMSEAAITIGGNTIFCTDFKIAYDPGLKADRRGIGNTKREPIVDKQASITVTLGGMEFESLTHYNSFIAGTQQAFVLTLTMATVVPTTANAYSFTVTIPKIDFDDANANVGGPGIVPQMLTGRGLYDGSNAPITVLIINGDTAA